MQYRIFLFAGFLLGPLLWTSVYNQSALLPHEVDSFQQVLLQANDDTTRYVALYALSERMSTVHLDSAKMYARQLIQLADEMQEPHRQVRAWRVLGGVFLDVDMLDSVAYAAKEALIRAEACQDERCFIEKLYATKLWCIIHRRQGNTRASLRLLQSLAETPGISDALYYEARRLMAFPYIELGDYDEALRQLQLVWEYSQKVEDQVLMCTTLGELTAAYKAVGEVEKAVDLVRQRITICQSVNLVGQLYHSLQSLASFFLMQGQLDSAHHYYQELSIITKDRLYNSISKIGLLETALAMGSNDVDEYARQALELLDQEVDLRSDVRQALYSICSSYFLAKKQYDLAYEYTREHLNLVRQHAGDTTESVVYAWGEMTKVQAAIGDYEAAWHAYDTFHQLKMGMVQRNQENALAQTAVAMNLAENDLARQQAEQAALLEQQTSASRTRFFLGLLGFAALILGVVVWAYRRAQRDKKTIMEKSQLVEQSLAEKEVLLREIHHRVKNNLQIISSLLGRQARKSSDDAVRKLVKEGQERIQSMALIHQNLYESEQLSGIDIKSYLKELSENIQKSQVVTAGQVELELKVEDEKLDIDTAIPVGLILNELLTNCYKYAFRDQASGKITVDFKKEEDHYFLKVSDDGSGFTPDQASEKTKSLGLNLVKGLVRQLQGSMEWLAVEQGAAVAIRF